MRPVWTAQCSRPWASAMLCWDNHSHTGNSRTQRSSNSFLTLWKWRCMVHWGTSLHTLINRVCVCVCVCIYTTHTLLFCGNKELFKREKSINYKRKQQLHSIWDLVFKEHSWKKTGKVRQSWAECSWGAEAQAVAQEPDNPRKQLHF
jgi:hypothetical protein